MDMSDRSPDRFGSPDRAIISGCEAVRGVPDHSGVFTSSLGKNCSCLRGGRKVPMALQPNLDLLWLRDLRQPSNAVGDPTLSGRAIVSGLNCVAKNANTRRAQLGCQIGHAFSLIQPTP